MTEFLFDTDVISALRKPERLEARVRESIRTIPKRSTYVSVISLLEIEVGILRIARRDSNQAAILRNWIRRQRAGIVDDRVLDISEQIAMTCAALHLPDRRPHFDSLIAATAIVHSLTLVTRNVQDFSGMDGLRVLNPWD